MQIQGLKTEINGKLLSLKFPDKKSIILRGTNNVQIIYIMECLLSNDFTGYYKDLDRKYGYDYKDIGTSDLIFDEGRLQGKDKVISTWGKTPNIHCIRYLRNGNFRSFLCSGDIAFSELYTNMTEYSNVIPYTSWLRLCSMVNSFIESNIVDIVNNKLIFNWDENCEYSIEAQKFIYCIIAECFLTPKGYYRVLLLPDIELLNKSSQIKLIEYLDNIVGHKMTLSTVDVQFNDLSESSTVSLLNV